MSMAPRNPKPGRFPTGEEIEAMGAHFLIEPPVSSTRFRPERPTDEEAGTVKFYTFTRGKFNVHYLRAPYELLVAAFGDDGTISPRDEDKSMASWDVRTPNGTVEVYDYTPGVGWYEFGGPDRRDMTEWHIRGSIEAIDHMLSKLDETSQENDLPKAVSAMLRINYMKLMGRDDA